MRKERRTGKRPISADVRSILSLPQKNALKELETFGWVIDYVRRPLFQIPTVVIRDPGSGRHALILEDGTVDHNPQEPPKRKDDDS